MCTFDLWRTKYFIGPCWRTKKSTKLDRTGCAFIDLCSYWTTSWFPITWFTTFIQINIKERGDSQTESKKACLHIFHTWLEPFSLRCEIICKSPYAMEINDFHQKVYLVYTHANVVALVFSLILTKLCQIVVSNPWQKLVKVGLKNQKKNYYRRGPLKCKYLSTATLIFLQKSFLLLHAKQ